MTKARSNNVCTPELQLLDELSHFLGFLPVMAVPVNDVGVRPLLSPRNPIWSLTLAFALWKALVFLVVIACPGPGYDTSTSLLPYQIPIPTADSASSLTHQLRTLPLKFVRWDAIYFVHIIEHGYVFEQEWAFGYGYTRLLNVLTSGMDCFSRYWI